MGPARGGEAGGGCRWVARAGIMNGRAANGRTGERANGRVEVFATTHELMIAAAEAFVASANNAIAQRGRFSIALAGGSTPKHMYSLLATKAYAERIDW